MNFLFLIGNTVENVILRSDGKTSVSTKETFDGLRVVEDFEEFKQVSDVIVANRLSEEIKDVREKVYTRDLFSRD